MLYALGPIDFEVAPFNTHKVDRVRSADFAAKDLLGRRKSHESVGVGDEKITLSGRLFPHKLGGLDALGVLDALCESGAPQFLMRGDMTPMGWFLIERVHDTSERLDGRGIGRQIEFEIELLRDDPPSAESYIADLFNLFG